MNKKQKIIEKINNNKFLNKEIEKHLDHNDFNRFVNEIVIAFKKYEQVKILASKKVENFVQEYRNNLILLRFVKKAFETLDKIKVSESVLTEKSKKIIFNELGKIGDKLSETIDEPDLKNKRKRIRVYFKKKDKYQFDIDYRSLNSRPFADGIEELIEDLFKIYFKYFIELRGELIQKNKIEAALKMSKFTSLILDLLEIKTMSYSKISDSIDLPSSSWSRISKMSLKSLRQQLKINN